MADCTLRIADFLIRLENRSGLPLALEGGYVPFIADSVDGPDIHVLCNADIPDYLRPDAVALYTANQDGHLLWDISEWKGGLRFRVFMPEAPFTLQQVALTDSGFQLWEVYSEAITEGGEQGICPLAYPLGPLLLYSLTVQNEAIMIHASGVFDGNRGRIFSGFSGVGKSTMAGIWKHQGARVINDDRLIIRNGADGYVIHNTPMFYADEPKQAPLHAVFLPFHSPQNTMARLKGSEAVSRLMAYCIQHGYEKTFIEHHLHFLSDMCGQLPVHHLGVVPNDEVIDFIREHESRG
ncbi:MAG: hypothetical protein K9J06_03715 [Flavobacteriales bacterium]|nr:hypothetical protein [Flavobacteriales bacterium]